jgi:HAD superfamily hydrolase (TIGR01484 family)
MNDPRPIEELSKFVSNSKGLRGLFTDIDGTLTDHDGLVPIAYEALARARRLGWRVVLVTGRPAGFAEVLATMWPVDAIVAENGAVAVVRQGRLLRTVFWDDITTQERNDKRLEELRRLLVTQVPWARLAADQRLRRCDIAFDIGEYQRLGPSEVTLLRESAERLGARVVVSSLHLHASFTDCNKAKMAARLASSLWSEELIVTRGQYLFVGDSPNDQSCFEYFPLSVGVANVRAYLPQLDPPPAFITRAPGGDGFAELMSHVLNHHRTRDSPDGC